MLVFRYQNLPKEITNQYDLILISNNGYAMIEIGQDRYRLPQTGTIITIQLIVHHIQYGYNRISTVGLF